MQMDDQITKLKFLKTSLFFKDGLFQSLYIKPSSDNIYSAWRRFLKKQQNLDKLFQRPD